MNSRTYKNIKQIAQKLCPKCGKPLRYVNTVTIAIMAFMPFVGAQCPDPNCNGIGVYPDAEWVASLCPFEEPKKSPMTNEEWIAFVNKAKESASETLKRSF